MLDALNASGFPYFKLNEYICIHFILIMIEIHFRLFVWSLGPLDLDIYLTCVTFIKSAHKNVVIIISNYKAPHERVHKIISFVTSQLVFIFVHWRFLVSIRYRWKFIRLTNSRLRCRLYSFNLQYVNGVRSSSSLTENCC